MSLLTKQRMQCPQALPGFTNVEKVVVETCQQVVSIVFNRILHINGRVHNKTDETERNKSLTVAKLLKSFDRVLFITLLLLLRICP